MSALRQCLAAGFLVVAFSGGTAAAQDGGPTLLSHRAVYELHLDAVADRSQIVGVTGTMAVSWEVSCEGWTVDQRYRLGLSYVDGNEVELVTRYASWEAVDGRRFSFSSRTALDGVLEEEVRGYAELSDDGGIAQYRLPEETEQALPPGTYFPTHHTMALLIRAEAGDRTFSAPLFDGTRADGLTEVSAVIGRGSEDEDEDTPTDAPEILADRLFWPIHLAFFDPAQADPEPDHEVSFRLYQGGIVDRLIINYGDFVLRGRAAVIEALPPPDDC